MRLSRGVLVNGGVALLGAASIIGVLATTNWVSTKESAGREQNLLSAFRAEDVISLELAQKGQKVALRRTQASDGGVADFELTSPVRERADPDAVEKFLRTLAGAKALRPVENTNATQLGLDDANLRISVKLDRTSYELELGGPAPAPSGAHYVEVSAAGESPKTFVIDKSVAEELALDLDAFRSRGIVSLAQSDVTRIAIQSPKLTVTLVHDKGRAFLLDGIPSMRADRDVVNALFFQLGRMTANRFLGAPEASAAIGATPAHFAIQAKDPTGTTRFDVGGACPGDDSQWVLVRQAPTAQSACTTRELEATLELTKDSFIDRHPFSLRSDEIEELTIESGAEKLRLVRRGTGFVLHQKTDSDVTLEAGNQRLTDLLDVTGTVVEKPELAALGLDPGRAKVSLRSAAGSAADVIEEVVRVGDKTSAGDLYVLREGDGVVLLLPRDHARAFRLDSTLLYDKKLTVFGPSSFISAEITRPGGRELLTKNAAGNPELEIPKGFGADGSLSGDVMQTLGALEAERFVADGDDGSFGFAHSQLVVRFAYKTEQSPKVERTLRFGDDTTLGVYATLDEHGPVFVLPRSVRDTLDTLLVDRNVFTLDTASLLAFTLEANGRSLRLERRGEHFEPGKAGDFPADHVPALAEAIGDLRPEAAIHTGAAEAAEGFAKPILVVHLMPKAGATQTLTFGAGDSWRGTNVFYLRVAGVDATYVIAQAKVRALLAAF